MSINEIKREYIKKGGNKYRNMIIIHASLFIFVLVTFLFIGVPQTGKGFKDPVNYILLVSIILVFLLSVWMFGIFIYRTKFKQIRVDNYQIAAFTNSVSFDKAVLKLIINGETYIKEFNKFVDYKWTRIRGKEIAAFLEIVFLFFDTFFYSKYKKEEIKAKKHIIKIEKDINGNKIRVEYNRFKKKLIINEGKN